MANKGEGGQRNRASSVHSKLRRLGLLESRSSKVKQLTFEMYFPRPPYQGAQYRAARGKDGLYNFVGLVLGHRGATVQRIQKASGAKVEVRDSAGNLNGAHPSSHGDPTLHAWVATSSRQRLDKAVALLLELLQPTNMQLQAVVVSPGGSVVLEPVVPREGDDVSQTHEQECEAAPRDAGTADIVLPPPPPPPPRPANAWATNRLQLKPRVVGRQMSPTSSLQRSQAAAAAAESAANSDTDEPEAPAPTSPPASGMDALHAVPPPPPPPPSTHHGRPATEPSVCAHEESPAQHAQLRSVTPPSVAPTEPAAHAEHPHAAVLQCPRSAVDLPVSVANMDSGVPVPQEADLGAGLAAARIAMTGVTTSTSPDATYSWSPWGGSGSSFYQQLQAAASGTILPAGIGRAGLEQHAAVASPAPVGPFALPPLGALAEPASLMPPLAPFPGIAPHGVAHGLSGGPTQAANASRDAEQQMQQLLAAVTSMATG